MKIEKFEDLDCWKAARKLVNTIYLMTRRDPFCRDFGLSGQIQRAAVSVMANIAEGFATKSDKEFKQFLNISIRSAVEVQSHLYVSYDVHYIASNELEECKELAEKCIALCKGLLRYINGKNVNT